MKVIDAYENVNNLWCKFAMVHSTIRYLIAQRPTVRRAKRLPLIEVPCFLKADKNTKNDNGDLKDFWGLPHIEKSKQTSQFLI